MARSKARKTADLVGGNGIARADLAADVVDSTKIADDSIDSEHIVDGSIDTAHIANNAVTAAKLAAGAAVPSQTGQSGKYLTTDGTNASWGTITQETAASILTKVKTVDGAGSGLDADTLDGNQATAFATAAQGATADAALPKAGGTMTGAITFAAGQAFDGRDVSADGSKLDGIEAGATADQTASEILTAIKTVDGAGSGLDADTLDGQQGSYYTGYTDTAISNLVDTAPSTLDTLNELAAALGDDPNFATTVSTNIGTKLPLAGGTMTGAITFAAGQTFDGRDVSADGSKLDGIESGATADQTASEILTAIKTVDGSGSGLDADTLDGLHADSFLRSDADDSTTGKYTINTPAGFSISTANDTLSSGFQIKQNTVNADAAISFHVGGDFAGHFGIDGGINDFAVGGWSYGANSYRVWHAGNDGAGSGLDADTLDGQQGSYYYPASNPNGYTTNVGDITGVTAGSGLTGGGTSGTVTISHSDTSSQGSVNNSGNTMIQDITLDTYGHVTGITSATVSASTFLTGQSWTDVTSSRAMNTWYTNSTGKPIIVQVDMDYGDLDLRTNGIGTGVTYVGGQHGINANDFMIVMPGEQYACLAAGGRYERYWFEYR